MPAKESKDLVENIGHQRASAEMRMAGEVNEAQRFLLLMVIELVLINLEVIHGVGLEHAVVDKFRPGNGNDVAARGGFPARQRKVKRIAMPFQTFLHEKVNGVLIAAIHRCHPPFGTTA